MLANTKLVVLSLVLAFSGALAQVEDPSSVPGTLATDPATSSSPSTPTESTDVLQTDSSSAPSSPTPSGSGSTPLSDPIFPPNPSGSSPAIPSLPPSGSNSATAIPTVRSTPANTLGGSSSAGDPSGTSTDFGNTGNGAVSLRALEFGTGSVAAGVALFGVLAGAGLAL